VSLLVYTFLCLIGKRPVKKEKRERDNFFDFLIHYFNWFIGPLERLLFNSKVKPDHLTMTGFVFCVGAGLAAATSHLATTFWLYVGAGALDILDGRLAKHQKSASKAGAFLDSVSDRWGELFVLCGFAWLIRDTYWLIAALGAISGSVLTSYARARGESLGIVLNGGLMQRGERMALVCIATVVTAYFDAASSTAEYGVIVIGVALALTALGTAFSAAQRWVEGYRLLKAQESNDNDDASPEPLPIRE
jgi:CDP-diacylglycerol--glycerol-3-phosphate 3-phosphatidyltransferase